MNFAQQVVDVNICLTAVNMLWALCDAVQLHLVTSAPTEQSEEIANVLWTSAFRRLQELCSTNKAEVRDSAATTLCSNIVARAQYLNSHTWEICTHELVLPLLSLAKKNSTDFTSFVHAESPGDARMIIHHSRNTFQKQWQITRMVLVKGVTEVCKAALRIQTQTEGEFEAWLDTAWNEHLKMIEECMFMKIKGKTETGSPSQIEWNKSEIDIPLTAVHALFDLIISLFCGGDAKPMYGVGMKVIDGTLVATEAMSNEKLTEGDDTEHGIDAWLWKSIRMSLDRMTTETGSLSPSIPVALKNPDVAVAVITGLTKLYDQTSSSMLRDAIHVESVLGIIQRRLDDALCLSEHTSGMAVLNLKKASYELLSKLPPLLWTLGCGMLFLAVLSSR